CLWLEVLDAEQLVLERLAGHLSLRLNHSDEVLKALLSFGIGRVFDPYTIGGSSSFDHDPFEVTPTCEPARYLFIGKRFSLESAVVLRGSGATVNQANTTPPRIAFDLTPEYNGEAQPAMV